MDSNGLRTTKSLNRGTAELVVLAADTQWADTHPPETYN